MARKNEAEIVEMYENGMSIAAICAELGCYSPQVYDALHVHGVVLRGRRTGSIIKPSSHDEILNVLRLYEVEGLSGAAIARKIKVPYQKVLNVLRNARVSLVPGMRPKKWEEATSAAMKDLKEGNLTIEEVMLKHGIISGGAMEKLLRRTAKFTRKFGQTPEGRVSAIVDEVLHQVRSEIGPAGAVQVGSKDYQLRLFDLDG